MLRFPTASFPASISRTPRGPTCRGWSSPSSAALWRWAGRPGSRSRSATRTLSASAFPHPNAALPRGIPRLTMALRREAGVPPEAMEFHGQNDLTAIIPNAVCAWLYGASANNGTLLGIGERSGNTPIESLVFWLISLTGETHGMDTRVITAIADYYRGIGEPIDVRLPLVGDNFNMTRAGVHADGLIKDEEIYNPFDTTRLLGRPPRVAITDKSGAAGLLMWVRDHRPELAAGLTKQDPRLRRLNETIIEEFSAGRITSLGDHEVGRLVDKAFM